MRQEVRYLLPDEYPQWDCLVADSPCGSVFSYSWWLQALPGDTSVLGYFENGQLVAGIPVHHQRRFSLSLCTLPHLTSTWGVVMEERTGTKTGNVPSREMEILRVFASHLASETFFFQRF